MSVVEMLIQEAKINGLEAKINSQAEEIMRLKALLLEAADEISDWGAYADEYFKNKHDLKGTIEKFRKAGT